MKLEGGNKHYLWLPLLLLAGVAWIWQQPGDRPDSAHAGNVAETAAAESDEDPLAITVPADPDSATLSSLTNRADDINAVRSLLVQQKGTLVMERYFDGMSSGRTMNLKSASKSVLSLLIGIAVDRGIIDSVDQPIRHYLPEYFEDIDSEIKRSITIKDLLTMRAGLETTSFHNYGRWVVSDDWVEFALEQPMEDRPGGDMVYSTGSTHLLSVILTRAAGMSTRAFANRHLFGPLDIEVGGWDRDPQGHYMGGNNMALRPSDMVKIGQMVLDGGVWEGERIVSRAWLKDSFRTYTRSNYNPYDYGYLWWKRPVSGYHVRFAWGYGGQYILMIPDLEAVVVMTSDPTETSDERGYQRPVFNLLEHEIIPMLEPVN